VKGKVPSLSNSTSALAPGAALPTGARLVDNSGRYMTAPVAASPQEGVGRGLSPEVARTLGLGQQQSANSGGVHADSAGLPSNMSAGAALSTAIGISVSSPFNEVDTMGDWDGREDTVADHGGKVLDSSTAGVLATPGAFFTREAISEHTIANGFAQDIFYQGDSVGNVYVSSSTNLTQAAPTPNTFVINLPTVANAFGTLGSNDVLVVTGLAVSPVADLGSFLAVNAGYTDFPSGLVGEILYVTFTDNGTGLRLASNNALVRSGVLAFPVSDGINGGAAAPPGRITTGGYPVTIGGAFGVAFSTFDNLAGCAVDDDGNLYFQQVDLIGLTGANIVKITSQDSGGGLAGPSPARQDRSLATSGFLTLSTLTPTGGNYGTASGPANQINLYTNYSGGATNSALVSSASTFFGNVISLATGPGNVVYAAMSRSFNAADDPGTQSTEGLFTNPAGLGPTPSMIITLADVAGQFDVCSSPNPGLSIPNAPPSGILPIGDGFADQVVSGNLTTWKAFVLGNGPDIRTAGANGPIFGTPTNMQKVDMTIDYTLYSGITVNEEGTAYVISGGTPSAVGRNPSPNVSEVLGFEDKQPNDRIADFVDLRTTGSSVTNPTVANVGDGISDRFDHIYYQAPIDTTAVAPAGLAGLTHGFLRYTNRLAPTLITPGVVLGSETGGLTAANLTTAGNLANATQGDDATTALPIVFENLDPSHQVAGGDDQVSPFRGDDDDGTGNPVLTAANVNGGVTANAGGFEFTFANPLGDVFSVGAACGSGNGVWNGFFLNSNGNITFGGGDTANISSDTGFRSGLPKIAPAWCDLNPASRAEGFTGTFPVQALGFANINAFKIRYINVPEFGHEACTQNGGIDNAGAGVSNTFAVTLLDDGTGIDENSNQPLNPANPIGNNSVPFDLLEGPTDNRFVKVVIPNVNTPILVGSPQRRDGTGQLNFKYARMDLLGTSSDPVITGFSIGNQQATNPQGLCEVNLGDAAVASDTVFGNILGQIESEIPGVLGDGTESEIHEWFRSGTPGSIDGGTGVITTAVNDYDLRQEGNGIAQALPTGQTDLTRDHLSFFGTSCQLPPLPTVLTVIAGPFAVTPTTSASNLINAYAPVNVFYVGAGFFANNATVICSMSTGDVAHPVHGDPIVPFSPRPGKTTTTAATVGVRTDGLAPPTPDTTTPLALVNVLSGNLIQGTLAQLPLGSNTGPGTWANFAGKFGQFGGGIATWTETTTFTAGDNNIFSMLSGAGFTRASAATVDVGARAPVVLAVSSTSVDATGPVEETISGDEFNFNVVTGPGSPTLRNFTVNAVFAQEYNPATGALIGGPIAATSFNVLTNNVIDAFFNFTEQNGTVPAGSPALPGSKFLIQVSNTVGTSRDALAPFVPAVPAGAPAPAGGAYPVGNEQGNIVQVTVIEEVETLAIACPGNVTVVAAQGASGAVATFTTPTVVDPDDPTQVNCQSASGLKSGMSFPLGTTTVTCTATDLPGTNTVSCNFTVTVNPSNTFSFSASNFTVNEGCVSVVVTVNLANPSGTSTVDVVTSDGSASQRSKYNLTNATLTFTGGATSASVSIPINNESYVEGNTTFNLTLANPTGGGVLGGPALATVTIVDDDTVNPPIVNINDSAGPFVCQQYHDFLDRDSDAAGMAFWMAKITADPCTTSTCTPSRTDVAEAYFKSAEFSQTGSFVLLAYQASFGTTAFTPGSPGGHGLPLPAASYVQFQSDRSRVVGGATLSASQLAFLTQFMARPAWVATGLGSVNNNLYVAALDGNTGGVMTAATKAALIGGLNGATLTRAQVLLAVTQDPNVQAKFSNQLFVAMQYFGYLRRDPDAAGFDFWLNLLNTTTPADARNMNCNFITSGEYQQRFSSVVNHSNAECSTVHGALPPPEQ
jgi:hypothetical protein